MAEHGRSAEEAVLAFGPFRLFRAQKLLLCGGKPVHLGGRAMDLLTALVERAGEVVSKDELVSIVWPSTFVDESNLRVNIAALRKALGDGHMGERYIHNISGRGYTFVAPVIREEPAAPDPDDLVRARRAMAPPRIVGRDADVAELVERLANHRFVTVVGPGGVGKSTLVLCALDHPSAARGRQVRYVDLAAINGDDGVEKAVSTALAISPQAGAPLESLVAALVGQWTLLVLDNCEHVISGAARFVDTVLAAAPGVSVLATSREPLRARLEWVHRLSPLATPAEAVPITPEEALAYPSVQLFVERAIGVLDTFELRPEDVAAAVAICQRLDGLPLAIELLAARVDMFGVHGLERTLDERLVISAMRRAACPRQRSLSAALDWSFTLLSPLEQRVLCSLSVFKGWFTLSAAVAVVGDTDRSPSAMLRVLVGLASKSLLVTQVQDSAILYRLLFVTRAFAAEKLAESGDPQAVARRHASHLRDVFLAAQTEWTTTSRREWLAAHGRLIDDLRAALDWAFSDSGDPQIAAALTIASLPFGVKIGQVAEFRARAERTLEILSARDDAAAVTAKIHLVCGLCHLRLTTDLDVASMEAPFAELMALCAKTDDPRLLIDPLNNECLRQVERGDYRQAMTVLNDMFAAARACNDPMATLMAERTGAWINLFAGDHRRAQQLAERVERHPVPQIPLVYGHGTVDRRTSTRIIRARALWLQGYPDDALDLILQSLELARKESPGATAVSLAMGACPIAIWTGHRCARELVADLADSTRNHGLERWELLGRHFRLALERRQAEPMAGRSDLLDYGPTGLMHREFLITVNPSLVDAVSTARAAAGCAGWCGPEVLRAAGEQALVEGGLDAMKRAETYFQAAIDQAKGQDAPAWTLRATTSLARIWRMGGRAQEAQPLLAAALAQFPRGQGGRDVALASEELAWASTSVDEYAPDGL